MEDRMNKRNIKIWGIILILLTTVFFLFSGCKKTEKECYMMSLHATTEGMRYWYDKDDGFSKISKIPYDKLGCKNCHAQSCEKCHGKGYARLYQQWEDNMKEKLSLVKLGLDKISDTNKITGSSAKLLKDAVYNYQLVETGNVVHNVAYSDELLLNAYENLKKVLTSTGSDLALPSFQLYNTAKPSKCENCHYGQESKKVEAFGILFVHSKHISNKDLSCLSCHSHKTNHGETVATRESCLSCHHTQEETECVQCHQIQTHIYDGTIEIYDSVQPDYMFEAEIECVECHRNEDDLISKENGRNCSNCHEEEYDSYVSDWQQDIQAMISDIQEKLGLIVYYDLDKLGRQKVDAVRYGIEKIVKDNSYGVHNYELVSDILMQYQTTVNNL